MLALIISMFSFSLSMSISPGPVNLTILNSSMNYGLRQTWGFISGATIGFTALLASVCFGLYQIIVMYPLLLDAIALFGTALLVWIGWNILKAKTDAIDVENLEHQRVPTFMKGALMQWLNPKAWIAAVSGTALFSASAQPKALAIFVLIYFLTCYFSLLIWGYAGDKLAHFLNEPIKARIFNVVMGTLLIGIALHMYWSHFML